MWVILLKEVLSSIILMGLAAIIVSVEAGSIPNNWFKLSAAIAMFFPASTVILNFMKKLSPQSPGWVLIGLSMLKMILIPTLIILLFEKEHEATTAVVIPTVIAYLILMGLDTSWKIKWIFR